MEGELLVLGGGLQVRFPSSLLTAKAAAVAAAGPPSASLSSPCYKEEECLLRLVAAEEEQSNDNNGNGWSEEQLEIVAGLLRKPPRPFPVNRAPLPPRVPSRHRPVGVPVRRVRPPNPSPRPAKHKHYLSRLARQISELPPHAHVSDIRPTIQHLLIRGSLSATIRELGHLGLPLRALETFEWQQQWPHLWPDERTLCAAIEVLAETGHEEKAWGLLHTHAPLSLLAFEALVRGLTAAGLLHSALLAKEKAENNGLMLGQGLYAELILLASGLNASKEMRKLVQDLGSFPELRLGLEHCTSIMTACRKARMYDTVLGLFQWWKQTGLFPNVVMYQIVMTSLSDLGKHRDALAIYWEMEKNGCAPHLPVYVALFEVCAQLGDTSRALKLFTRMRESNIAPTHNVYTNLIKVCCRDGRLGKAKEVMDAMRKEGFSVEGLNRYTNL